jgi:ABC-type uncharacterized transport system substrate-binding protein
MRACAVILCLIFWGASVRAHPHVFIEAQLRFVTSDAGKITGVEVTWIYDAFHTLLLLEERGFDSDGDGQLTEEERSALIGFDLTDWPDWFEGGLFVHAGERKVALGPPHALTLDVRDGRLVTRHARSLGPVGPDGLVVQPYDPSYFAAITVGDAPQAPEGCAARVLRADPDAAAVEMAAQLDMPSDVGTEDTTIGILFADTMVIECAPV